jgi:hypothetical protein
MKEVAHVSLQGHTTDRIDLGAGIRLQLNHFENGWGRHACEEFTKDGWRAPRTPAAENRRHRFRTRGYAQQFFQVFAEFM